MIRCDLQVTAARPRGARRYRQYTHSQIIYNVFYFTRYHKHTSKFDPNNCSLYSFIF